MFSEDKVTEIFCLADEFCKFFYAQQEKSMLEPPQDGKKHRRKPNRMSDAEIIVILIHFHSGGFRCFKHYYLHYICTHCKHLFPNTVSYNRFVELQKEVLLQLMVFIKQVLPGEICLRKRALIETVNDELKNIAQIEHSRHRSFSNFIANALSAIAANCFFEKKPAIDVEWVNYEQLSLF